MTQKKLAIENVEGSLAAECFSFSFFKYQCTTYQNLKRLSTEAELWFEGSRLKKMCGQSVFTCNAMSMFSSAFHACLFGSSRLRSPW